MSVTKKFIFNHFKLEEITTVHEGPAVTVESAVLHKQFLDKMAELNIDFRIVDSFNQAISKIRIEEGTESWTTKAPVLAQLIPDYKTAPVTLITEGLLGVMDDLSFWILERKVPENCKIEQFSKIVVMIGSNDIVKGRHEAEIKVLQDGMEKGFYIRQKIEGIDTGETQIIEIPKIKVYVINTWHE